jgi:branched-chain amino acid transport system permease protein
VDKFLIFTIVGLSTAAIYAVIASGLVLTYTTTGVFNFAQGAAGMLAAFTYWQMTVGWGWPAPLAVFAVLFVLAPGFGVLLERVIFRGLEGTSEATKLVVSISLLVAMIGFAQWVWAPDQARVVLPFFSGDKFDVGSTTITYHQAITIFVAIAVAIGLRLLLYRTRLGVAMRAVVDDRSLARLNGTRTAMVARSSWAIGTSLAALGGILIASSAGLSATVLSLLIVNAYGAAVFGRLRSLPWTFVGAIVLGCLDGYLAGYLPSSGSVAAYVVGLRLASPVILLFVVLLVLPNRRLRSHVRTREFFPAPTTKGLLMFSGLTLAFGLVLATTLSDPDLLTYSRIFALGIVALSLVPLVGYAGQISLCQLSFAGIGAIVMAHLGGGGNPVGLLAAVVVCALLGALVALPALRLQGIYMALATAAFAVLLDRWVFVLPNFSIGPLHVKLFELGTLNVDPIRAFGYKFSTPESQMVLVVVVFVLLSLVVVAVRRSAFGRRLLAIRDSEAACATFGLNLVGTRLAVFMLSAAIAGLGGAIYATQLASIGPNNFDFFTGLPIFMLVVIGGAGFVGGALVAGVSLAGLLPLLASIWAWFANIQTMLPGLAGIGLGRQPSGAAPQFSAGLAPLRDDTPVLVSMLGGMAVVWILRLAGVIANWPMVVLFGAVFVAALVAVQLRGGPTVFADAARQAMSDTTVTPTPAVNGREKPVPLEWVGITVPWTPDRVAEIDRRLGIESTPKLEPVAVAVPGGDDGTV